MALLVVLLSSFYLLPCLKLFFFIVVWVIVCLGEMLVMRSCLLGIMSVRGWYLGLYVGMLCKEGRKEISVSSFERGFFFFFWWVCGWMEMGKREGDGVLVVREGRRRKGSWYLGGG